MRRPSNAPPHRASRGTTLWWVVLMVVAALVCAAVPARAGGGWDWPLRPAPRVVRGFDPPATPWAAGHRGVDLLSAPGMPVLSPAAGTVVYAGALAGRGVVVVETGGLRSTVEPVTPAVRVGSRVAAGALIGHVQAVHGHCLPRTCVHWGVKRGRDGYRDPLALLGGAGVVLLPFHGPGASRAAPRTWSPATERGAAPARAGRPGRVAPHGAASTALRFALGQIGDPYVWAAAGPDAWDCSGLTMAAWRAAGRSLPHYSVAQFLSTTPVTRSQLRPGDLVFWSGGSGPSSIFHVALYLGAGRVVHAPHTGARVRIERMDSWARPDYFARV